MKSFDDSILKVLGFTKMLYENSHEYEAEQMPNMMSIIDICIDDNVVGHVNLSTSNGDNHLSYKIPYNSKILQLKQHSSDTLYIFDEPYEVITNLSE